MSDLEDIEDAADEALGEVLPEPPRDPKFRVDDQPKHVNVIDVRCPKCQCDFVVPLMKIHYVNSFAGNKMQVAWPSREGANEWGMVACASCWEIVKIGAEGSLTAMGKKLKPST